MFKFYMTVGTLKIKHKRMLQVILFYFFSWCNMMEVTNNIVMEVTNNIVMYIQVKMINNLKNVGPGFIHPSVVDWMKANLNVSLQ